MHRPVQQPNRGEYECAVYIGSPAFGYRFSTARFLEETRAEANEDADFMQPCVICEDYGKRKSSCSPNIAFVLTIKWFGAMEIWRRDRVSGCVLARTI